jgi:Necrosis inducing protein (NPP1)
MKYVSIKSSVIIIAISFLGSQAWARTNWDNVKTCSQAKEEKGKEVLIRYPQQEKWLVPACMNPLSWKNYRPEPLDFYVYIDFDNNGCLPSAGVSPVDNGGMANPGINHTGNPNGACSYKDQLEDYSNTMYRKRCVRVPPKEYCVMMFAFYFVKDQAVPGPVDAGGHRHDWEWGLMWTTRPDEKSNFELTHASFGYHDQVRTKKIEDLFPETKRTQKFVYMRYYKSGGSTHTMGPFDAAYGKKREEKHEIENPTGHWYRPDETPAGLKYAPSIVDWDKLPCNIQKIFDGYNYGTAKMPMNRTWFGINIERTLPEKGKPGAYPTELFSQLKPETSCS